MYVGEGATNRKKLSRGPGEGPTTMCVMSVLFAIVVVVVLAAIVALLAVLLARSNSASSTMSASLTQISSVISSSIGSGGGTSVSSASVVVVGCVAGAPVSGLGITPCQMQVTPGPSCANYGLLGFRIEGGALTSGQKSLAGASLPDPNNYVYVNFSSNLIRLNSFYSTLPIDAVILKSATYENVYSYLPKTFSDTGLQGANSTTQYQISYVEFCYSYALKVVVSATGQTTMNNSWSVQKTASPNVTSQFYGNSQLITYTASVGLQSSVTSSVVSGVITIFNPSPVNLSITITDYLLFPNGTQLPVTLLPGCPSIIPANGTITCGYQSSQISSQWTVQDYVYVLVNTHNAYNVSNTYSTVSISWNACSNVGPTSVTLQDALVGNTWYNITGSRTVTFTYQMACPRDSTLYVNGQYNFTKTNYVSLIETGQMASTDVFASCYAPVVTKNSSLTYTRAIVWTLAENATYDSVKASLSFPGDTLPITYSVQSNRSTTYSVPVLSGTITVYNPNPSANMPVYPIVDSVVGLDVASQPVVSCPPSLVIAPESSIVCNYTTTNGVPYVLDSNSTYQVIPAQTDISTVTFNGDDFTTTSIVVATVVTAGAPAVSMDEYNSDSNQTTTYGNYTDSFTFTWVYVASCPSLANMTSLPIQVIYISDNTSLNEPVPTVSAIAPMVNLTCVAPAFTQVYKTSIDGPLDIGQLPLTFDLYAPNGTVVESATVTNSSSVFEFTIPLVPAGLWSIEERIDSASLVGWTPTTSEPLCEFTVAYPANAGNTINSCNFTNRERALVWINHTTNGIVDSTLSWSFQINATSTVVATDNSYGDVDGMLTFGNTSLDTQTGYTICELNVPAGWISKWSVTIGSTEVSLATFNPDSALIPSSQSVGRVCYTILPSNPLHLSPGEILTINVDTNRTTIGEPRTVEYWMEWNNCSNTNNDTYATVAIDNGGWSGGYWLLEDVLDTSIPGAGISQPYNLTSCTDAVGLLSQWSNSTDCAYPLAAQLIAAESNVIAGAIACNASTDAISSAQSFLTSIGFNGSGSYLPAGDAQCPTANALMTKLDYYNNGLLCSCAAYN